MARKLWFKNKRYGWGWYPATKEGWLVMAVHIMLFIVGEIIFMGYYERTLSRGSIWAYVSYVILITGLLIWICYKKGEKPGWRWGGK